MQTLFKVITPKSIDRVLLVGSTPELGSWEPAKGVAMTRGASIPLWTTSVDVSDPKAEYKFVIPGGDDSVRWEDGENRSMSDKGPLWFRGLPQWRGAGTAIPVFSLRSDDDFGIGDFADLRLMADWAAATGQSVIQILPVNDTTMTRTKADSYPYNACSSFALHPAYLRVQDLGEVPEPMAREMIATCTDLQQLPVVDYETAIKAKERWARTIYDQRGDADVRSPQFAEFVGQNHEWLFPYAAYSVLRDQKGTADFNQWGDEAKYSPAIVARMLIDPEQRREMFYYCWLQQKLHEQLLDAARYCRARGVALKGDIPIGVSSVSADAWQYPELFNMDSSAGAPPDDFAVNGQNWGFPTYNWDAMARDDYRWWRRRLQKMSEYFDAYRIDHVLGFFRIWEIPADCVHGILGHFSPALPMTPQEMLDRYGFEFHPRMARPFNFTEGFPSQLKALEAGREDLLPLFDDVLFVPDPRQPGRWHPRISPWKTESFQSLSQEQQQRFGAMHEDFFYHLHNDFWRRIAETRLATVVNATSMLPCAEDLGMLAECVPVVLNELQVLSLEVQRMPKQPGVKLADPKTYPYMCVATTSTHDMPPLRLWWMQQTANAADPTPEQCRQVISDHMVSPAMLAILPLQDWMAVDGQIRRADPAEEQINVPADPHHYWRYRLHLPLEALNAATPFNQNVKSLVAERP